MIFTVEEVNKYASRVLQMEDLLQDIMIRGEISNLKRYRSGHMYFSLKDSQSVLRCVYFRGDQDGYSCSLKDGGKVVLTGNISLYVRDGQYQLVVKDAKSDGIGSFYVEYERIKEKLSKEGLFDSLHKRKLPAYPSVIGVATSEHGAAVRDIIRVIDRRYNGMNVILAPCKVQGEGAAGEIIQAVKQLDAILEVDIIIVGRGGGSIEDLWAFNDENLARTIFSCTKPVISAVGHEVDFTICDFVADIRAATPSAAAELIASPSISDTQRIDLISSQIDSLILRAIDITENKLKEMRYRLHQISPNRSIDLSLTGIKAAGNKLDFIIRTKILNNELRLKGYESALKALSHENILKKGYAIVTGMDNNVIKTVMNLPEKAILHMKDGRAEVKVISKREELSNE